MKSIELDIPIFSIIITMILCLFTLFVTFLVGRQSGLRNTRCDIVCDMLNSKPIACETGVTVCANNKIVWRKTDQP
jgi:hypothetical protein